MECSIYWYSSIFRWRLIRLISLIILKSNKSFWRYSVDGTSLSNARCTWSFARVAPYDRFARAISLDNWASHIEPAKTGKSRMVHNWAGKIPHVKTGRSFHTSFFINLLDPWFCPLPFPPSPHNSPNLFPRTDILIDNLLPDSCLLSHILRLCCLILSRFGYIYGLLTSYFLSTSYLSLYLLRSRRETRLVSPVLLSIKMSGYIPCLC